MRLIFVLKTNIIITGLKILELLVNIHTLICADNFANNLWTIFCTHLKSLKNKLFIQWQEN